MAADMGPVGDVDGTSWRRVLGLAATEEPDLLVVEGSWWREAHVRARLASLSATRELGVPDVFIGSARGRQVLYACHYGAARTAETVQIAALVGVRLAVQLGSCGILGDGVRPGDVIVPTQALGLDGVTAGYADGLEVAASGAWSDLAAAALTARGISVRRGPTVTWPTLFNQPRDQVRRWRDEGRLGVDMETATTLAVAARFSVPAIALLVAWDELLSERSFLDPLAESDARAFAAAEESVFDVATGLAAASRR
jgi:uridine phosphorylase